MGCSRRVCGGRVAPVTIAIAGWGGGLPLALYPGTPHGQGGHQGNVRFGPLLPYSHVPSVVGIDRNDHDQECRMGNFGLLWLLLKRSDAALRLRLRVKCRGGSGSGSIGSGFGSASLCWGKF